MLFFEGHVKNGQIVLDPPAQLPEGTKVRIELVPKNEEIRHSIKKCELWIPDNGVPVQQKFYEGGGDYQIATYSHNVLNPNIPDSAVKLDLLAGDQLKLKARQIVIWGLVGLTGGIAGLVAIITSVVFLLQGAARGLAELLGGRIWAGQLIVASAVLLVVGLGRACHVFNRGHGESSVVGSHQALAKKNADGSD